MTSELRGKIKYEFKECGKRIQQLRKERGLSQEQLSEELNVSQNMIAKIECGLRRPSVDFLVVLANFFDVSTDYLVLGETEEVENEILEKKVDEAIEKIDIVIEKLLEKKDELLKMKNELK